MNKETNEPGQTISLPDGRQLGYLIVGEGKPVFWIMPGSRVQALCLKGTASSEHLQIISVDRPGFGLSTYVPNRRISDFAADVSYLADHLGIDKFILAGWCAGGPYVITCAALLRERVTRALDIGGPSLPIDTSDMGFRSKIEWKLPTVPIVGTWSTNIYVKKQKNMFVRTLMEEYGNFGTTSSENGDILIRGLIEMYHQGSDTIRASTHQIRLYKKGWEVDLSQIPSGLVHVWHGTTDYIIPVSNSYKNSKAIPGAQLRIFKNEGHLCWLDHLEELGQLLRS